MVDISPIPATDMVSGDLTVSELTRMVKSTIEGALPTVSIVGELSNYVHHSSGHRYFTLKDEYSQLRCVMFKWQAGRITFTPEEGMMLRAIGNVTVYERGGQYQLTVVDLTPLGRGELLIQLEKLKKRLAEEGVFDNNRPLPVYPQTVGVVTSPTGAAIRDIISVIRRRAPHVRIILRPALVQGTGAAEDIAEGIRDLNRISDVDVIIVGRGGGSIEDLWCFNEEVVARSIAGSGQPVVSAVGHETDFTIADLAADLRAPTPSAAAELVVKDSADLRQLLAGYRSLLRQRMLARVDELALKVKRVETGLSPVRFLQNIMMQSQAVDDLSVRMKSAGILMLMEREKTAEGLRHKLHALNPRGVLERGYAIVYRDSDRKVITASDMVAAGDRVLVELAKGSLKAVVKETSV